MQKITLFFMFIAMISGVVNGQDRYIRLEYGQGIGKFTSGYDLATYYDNTTLNVGLILENETFAGELWDEDRKRIYYGIRYRSVMATTPSTIENGLERYRYDNLELPLGMQADVLSLFEHFLVAGLDLGITGAFPLNVEGERTGPNVTLPWSGKYETPWFIFGLNIGVYAGINIKDKVGLRYGGYYQIPFIPIGPSVPDGQTDPGYETQLINDQHWTISLTYKFIED